MNLYIEIVAALTRAITGSLYTDDQIKSITKGATGKYLKEFFPENRNEKFSKNRADFARNHIEAASTIIRDMQEDLEAQDEKLSTLLETISEKKKLADRYQTLADANKEALDAFRIEMEEALRKELVEQANNGKRVRQLAAGIIWIITLIAGASLSTYFKEILNWVSNAY
ncbi:hypothetical protein ACTXJ2_04620 [Psychrobacter alimentarius]|uniref:hypothetical protein n=1 Tax=Psychrobacter TaxID=497 RepID=UPI000BAB0EAD|nr:hypothetical protein [Psychrobacter sp. JB193]PAT63654.1 hypothetical protein CIK80_00600 [Psychrobacter sp. JB193]